MSTLTLTFTLPEEQDQMARAVHANVAWDALDRIRQAIRDGERDDRPSHRMLMAVKQALVDATVVTVE